VGAFRFRRSIRIAPGIKLNLNKKSVSLTGGVRGAHVTRSYGGRSNYSVGLPGTGVWYRGSLDDPKGASQDREDQESLGRELATAPEGTWKAKLGNFFFWLGGLGWIVIPAWIVSLIAGTNFGLTYLATAGLWTVFCLALSIRRYRRIHRKVHRSVTRVDPAPPPALVPRELPFPPPGGWPADE
jgi:Protein of unknown function (DUF4236)